MNPPPSNNPHPVRPSLPRPTVPARRGSVIILVIAVLVLLALIGTAFITTSRSDRGASIKSESQASLDILAAGVVSNISAALQAQQTIQHATDANPTVGGTYPVFSPAAVSPGLFGLPILASRAPTAFVKAGTATVLSSPHWPAISAPLGAISFSAGLPYPLPYASSPTGSGYEYTKITGQTVNYPPYTDRTVSTSSVLPQAIANSPLASPSAGNFSNPLYGIKAQVTGPDGVQTPNVDIQPASKQINSIYVFQDADGVARGHWGGSDTLRRDLLPFSFTYNNNTYPAFYNDYLQSWVLAADADGDGVADSGYFDLGTLSNTEYAGLHFYGAVRVVDGNSAINVNTAWTSVADYDFASPVATTLRNNRLSPASIGLRESLAPDMVGNDPPAADAAVYSPMYGSSFTDFAGNFIIYRSGNDSPTANGQNVPYEYDSASGKPAVGGNTKRRSDTIFNTLLEQDWFQHGRRLDVNGGHFQTTSASGAVPSKFVSFSVADQAALATGFVLTHVDSSVNYDTASSRSSLLEQALQFSLYRPSASGSTSTLLPGYSAKFPSTDLPRISSTPYPSNQIGFRGQAVLAANTTWYGQSFGYEVDDSDVKFASPVFNLRPFAVTHNPLSQAVTFKPLPHIEDPQGDLVLADTKNPTVPFDRMTPFVPKFDVTTNYVPGQLVRYDFSLGSAEYRIGYYYQSGFVNGSTYTPVAPVGVAPFNSTNGVTGPWKAYTAPLVPTKVDVNRAAFGDLWRGFYLTMASDKVAFSSNASGNGLATNSVTPFGPHTVISANAAEELYRGMRYNPASDVAQATPVPADVLATPANSNSTFHPQHQFRSNLKDNSIGTDNLTIPPDQMVVLRAAQAAVNAEYLRQANGVSTSNEYRDDIVRRNIAIKVLTGVSDPSLATSANEKQMMAEVYSAGKFPYITELYVTSDPGFVNSSDVPMPTQPGKNPGGFFALELHNPYPFAMSLDNFKIQRISRVGPNPFVTTTGGRDVEDVFKFSSASTVSIPADGVIILTNCSDASFVTVTAGGTAMDASGDAPVKPEGVSVPAGTIVCQVSGLGAVVNHEMILLRPMTAKIDIGAASMRCDAPGDSIPRINSPVYPETNKLVDATVKGREFEEFYVPFDSLDCTGIDAAYVPGTDLDFGDASTPLIVRSRAYHYAREMDNWKFVYPGRYDGRAKGTDRFNQEGLRVQTYQSLVENPRGNTSAAVTDGDTISNPNKSLGVIPNDTEIDALTVAGVPPVNQASATYTNVFPIQISNWGFGGLNPAVKDNTTGLNRFPFGGFLRQGDMLQIPFISPVKLRDFSQAQSASAPYQYVDVISLTADAAFAEDSDTYDDAEENIGRFTPIVTPFPIQVTSNNGTGQYPLSSGTAQTPGYRAAALDELAICNDPASVVTSASADIKSDLGFYDQKISRYGWAARLFDNFTVASTSSLASPDVEPYVQPFPVPPGKTVRDAYDAAHYPSGTYTAARDKIPQPVAVKAANYPFGITPFQTDVGGDGLININTAPLPVLAAIPWVQPASTSNTDVLKARQMNLRIAQAIIDYREPRVGAYDTANQGKPLPFRPFHSIFELNRVLISKVAISGAVTYLPADNNPTTSFRSGGVTDGVMPSARWSSLGANEVAPTISGNPVAGQKAFTDSQFLTGDNGVFLPQGGSTFAALPTPDPNLIGPLGTGPHSYATSNAKLRSRNPVGDFESQFLMMTSVSNLITTRSDTFTAYVLIEGWANAGTPDATRIVQRRYAYMFDRNGAVTGLPADSIVGGSASVPSVMVKPTNAAVPPPGQMRRTLVPAVGN